MWGRFALVPVLAAIALTLVACDEVVDFTIVNDTDTDIITWVLLADCDERGSRDEYRPEEIVPAHGRLHYEDIFGAGGPPEGRCVQASTLDRRLILSEPYREGEVYTIEQPLEEGPVVPEQTEQAKADYPMQWLDSTYEGLQERPLATLIWMALVGTFVFLIPLGAMGALLVLVCSVAWRLVIKPALRFIRH